MPATISVMLKNPDRKATTVSEVRGEIELFMPSKDANMKTPKNVVRYAFARNDVPLP